ncbi:MAG TPA: CPBP family intramembrane glutamic endopeptidase [Victivallales bacterium]|nr:CPBP family intramembrane glutamic endopeptidase [Victivallales bacterium]
MLQNLSNSLNNKYKPEEGRDNWIDRACPILAVFIVIAIIAPTIIALLFKVYNYEMSNFLKICISLFTTQIFFIVSPLVIALIVSRKIKLRHKLLLVNWNFHYLNIALLYEIVLFLPLMSLTVLIYFIASKFGYTYISPLAELLSGSGNYGIALVFLFSVFIAPIIEEIVFRRVIFTFVERMFGILPAVIATSLIFSFLHGGIIQIIPLFILGSILQYLYIKYNSLYPSILLHSFHNLIIMSLFVLYK